MLQPFVMTSLGKVFLTDSYDWDLQLYGKQYYQWKISINNENLLDKNISKKKYWIKNIGRRETL